MLSVFKKLLHKEFGEACYNHFFFCFQQQYLEKKQRILSLENEPIFREMYTILKEKDTNTLKKMENRLSDAMFLSVRISKSYIFSCLFYITAVLILIVLGLAFPVMIISIVFMTMCFLYKTFEFIVNKYSYIDAYMVLIYKAALDRIIE